MARDVKSRTTFRGFDTLSRYNQCVRTQKFWHSDYFDLQSRSEAIENHSVMPLGIGDSLLNSVGLKWINVGRFKILLTYSYPPLHYTAYTKQKGAKKQASKMVSTLQYQINSVRPATTIIIKP